jgi:rhomboid protease GluP
MPSKKQEFSFPGYDSVTLLNLAYGTVLQLGWTPRFTVETTLVAHTPRSWKKYNDEVTISAEDNKLSVSSSLIHGEAFDMTGKNQKHIDEFIGAFQKIKTSSPDPEWPDAIEQLRQQTITTVTEEVKQAEEIDKVMNLSGSNLYATYAIIAINAVVFILMVINGAGLFTANPIVHIQWGSNYTPFTLSGDWWRLITNVFIHFGILHIAMNSYAFYMIGIYLEPMLGKTKYIVAYLCTGILASLVSLWWHKEGVNSAGASGAIFGMYGVFLAFLFTNLIPKQIRNAQLQTIGIFVVYNLVYGMKSGVDNSAHIGGLLSGMVIGFIYYLTRNKEEEGNKKQFAVVLVAAATIVIAWIYLKEAAVPYSEGERTEVENYLQESKYKDSQLFFEKIKELEGLEETAIAPLNDTALNNIQLADKLNEVSGEWDKATNLLEKMKSFEISETAKQKVGLLLEYVLERKKEIATINKIAKEEKTEDYQELNTVREKISQLINKLRELN